MVLFFLFCFFSIFVANFNFTRGVSLRSLLSKLPLIPTYISFYYCYTKPVSFSGLSRQILLTLLLYGIHRCKNFCRTNCLYSNHNLSNLKCDSHSALCPLSYHFVHVDKLDEIGNKHQLKGKFRICP